MMICQYERFLLKELTALIRSERQACEHEETIGIGCVECRGRVLSNQLEKFVSLYEDELDPEDDMHILEGDSDELMRD